MEVLVAILIFLAAIAIGFVAFCAWLAVRIIALLLMILWNVIAGFRSTRPRKLPPRQGTLPVSLEPTTCSNRLCVAQNPPGARFCRRCGQRQARPLLVPVRRAAVW